MNPASPLITRIDPLAGFNDQTWAPFKIAPPGKKPHMPRSLRGPFGVADRLRWVSFAEYQAARGFYWAAHHFSDADESLKQDWLTLSREETKHFHWLYRRMHELGIDPAEKDVGTQLWESFLKCDTARAFSFYMASAEERGRVAGELFSETLATIDPVSSELFHQIALEEKTHIEIAMRYYPEFRITAQCSQSHPLHAV